MHGTKLGDYTVLDLYTNCNHGTPAEKCAKCPLTENNPMCTGINDLLKEELSEETENGKESVNDYYFF